MDIFVVLIILAVLAGLIFFLRSRLSGKKGNASERLPSGAAPAALGAERQNVTLETLRPGDAVVFWDGKDALAESVLDCAEQVGPRTVAWRWILLDSGTVIEVSDDGRFIYTESMLFPQGSWEFERLTADIDHEGVFRTFEERVREGTSGSDPVYFTLHDTVFKLNSTGTFKAKSVAGKEAVQPVWKDVSADPGDNVYAGFSADDDVYALAVWTTHIAFLQGREMSEADIRGLYGA